MSNRRAHIHTPGNLLDKATDKLTAFSGSWLFLLIHVLWFGLWIGLRIEPFPFGLLTMMVSLEAIGLATVVLMSQNRQAARDKLRDDTEADEISSMFENHEELLTLNRQQLTILHQQTEILNLLHELSSKPVPVRRRQP